MKIIEIIDIAFANSIFVNITVSTCIYTHIKFGNKLISLN